MTERPAPRLDHVVIGTDFGEPSLAGARWVARHLAPESRLTLVHALGDASPPRLGEPGPVPSEAELAAARARASARLRELGEPGPGRSVRAVVGEDRAEWVIAEVAESSGADLVVVGPHVEEDDRRSRLGSTAERLIRMSPVPVLMADTPPEGRPRSILVPVDYVDLTPAVLDWARLFALRDGASVTLMHVTPPDGEGAGREGGDDALDARAWMEGMSRDLPGAARVELVATESPPGDAILDAVARLEPDMIVLGRRGRGRTLPGVLGSTVSDVLRGAERPVLVVVDPRDAILDDWETATEAA